MKKNSQYADKWCFFRINFEKLEQFVPYFASFRLPVHQIAVGKLTIFDSLRLFNITNFGAPSGRYYQGTTDVLH